MSFNVCKVHKIKTEHFKNNAGMPFHPIRFYCFIGALSVFSCIRANTNTYFLKSPFWSEFLSVVILK